MTRIMTIEELKPLVGNLPGGAGAWNAALRLAYEEYQAKQPNYDAVIADARKVLDGKPTAEIAAKPGVYRRRPAENRQNDGGDCQFQQVLAEQGVRVQRTDASLRIAG